MENNRPAKPIHILTLVVLIIGAVGSLCFMLITAHHNKSVILMGLFTGWTLSPFAALIAAKQKSILSTQQLSYLAPIIALGSLIAYLSAFFSPSKTPAFIFLIVPLVSWLVIVIVFLFSKNKKRNVRS